VYPEATPSEEAPGQSGLWEVWGVWVVYRTQRELGRGHCQRIPSKIPMWDF